MMIGKIPIGLLDANIFTDLPRASKKKWVSTKIIAKLMGDN
jgi:hypothetical protein